MGTSFVRFRIERYLYSNLYLLIVFYIELRIQQLIERIEQFAIELKQQLFYLKVHW